jgi:hypothetical protein
MAFGLLAAITFVVLILGFVLQIDDDRTVAFRARFRTRIGRGWEAVTGSRAGEREDQLDLLGAVVLAREGRAALAGRDPLPRPACQVNPLHGPALRRPPRGRPPKAPRKLVALCAGCRGCPAGDRDQRALLTDGVPYYRTEGFWARTGFGALDPDLPARVLEYLGVG